LTDPGGLQSKRGEIAVKFNQVFGAPAYAVASFALLGPASAVAGTYTYTTLDPPGQTSSRAYGINDKDEVTGTSSAGTFVWSKGVFTTVPTIGGSTTTPQAINAKGLLTGVYTPSGAYNNAEFTFKVANGKLTTPKLPANDNFVVQGINIAGTVVGYTARTKSAPSFLINGRTVTWLTAPETYSFAEARAINDAGTVAGDYHGTDHHYHGYIEQGGTYTSFDAPGATNTYTTFITNDGVVGGYWFTAGGTESGYTINGGTATSFSYPGSNSSIVAGVDAAGVVAGYYSSGDSGQAFVWIGGTYYNINVPGATDTNIIGINSKGSLVGIYTDSAGNHAYIAQCPSGQSPCTQ
jgi:hypothetical protein